MTSHCAGTVQTREESESGTRKWEEMWFKTTAEDGERGQQWRAIKDSSTECVNCCFVPRVHTTSCPLTPTQRLRFGESLADIARSTN